MIIETTVNNLVYRYKAVLSLLVVIQLVVQTGYIYHQNEIDTGAKIELALSKSIFDINLSDEAQWMQHVMPLAGSVSQTINLHPLLGSNQDNLSSQLVIKTLNQKYLRFTHVVRTTLLHEIAIQNMVLQLV